MNRIRWCSLLFGMALISLCVVLNVYFTDNGATESAKEEMRRSGDNGALIATGLTFLVLAFFPRKKASNSKKQWLSNFRQVRILFGIMSAAMLGIFFIWMFLIFQSKIPGGKGDYPLAHLWVSLIIGLMGVVLGVFAFNPKVWTRRRS